MNRDYANGETSNKYTAFVGKEVEHTVHYNKTTLFLVGTDHMASDITAMISDNNVEHIYLGANKSFKPASYDNLKFWECLIAICHTHNLPITLDIGILYVNHELVRSWATKYPTLAYMVSVEVRDVDSLPPTTTFKVDDIDFAATNRGVWCHGVTQLTHPTHHTSWNEYKNDKPIY